MLFGSSSTATWKRSLPSTSKSFANAAMLPGCLRTRRWRNSRDRELEARIAKLEAQWLKVTEPLKVQLQQARAEREAAGQRQLFEITATRTLVESWQQIASPADRQAEADLNRQLRDLGERWRAVENDLNPARPGSHAAELSSHQSRLRQPDRHPSDVANDRGAIERLEPFIERLRQHHAELESQMDQIRTKLESLRQSKLTP
jgi:chromosome segregation ATPase